MAPERFGDRELRAVAGRGLSYKYDQRIEGGRVNLTIRTLARVTRALGVSREEVFRSPAEGAAFGRRRARKNGRR